MEHNVNYYRIIQGTNGVDNMKEAKVRAFRQDVQNAFHKTMNWEKVIVNRGYCEQELEIVPTNEMTTKKFKARPGERVRLGDLITWRGTYWIVNTLDADNQINYQGTMTQCNYTLRWQLDDGSIYDEYGWCKDASKYSFGEFRKEFMDTANFIMKVIVQINENTLKLRRNKRFLVGAYGEGSHLMAVEISRLNPITNTYAFDNEDEMFGSGILEITLHESQFNPQKDNEELRVADYIPPQSAQPQESEEEEQEETEQQTQTSTAPEGGWF